MKINQKPLAHFHERPEGVKATFLIIHYTDTVSAEKAEDYFFGRIGHPTGGRVSAHYMIDKDGAITQYVPEDKAAWHAGISHWDGLDGLNDHSIGIELVNDGHTHGYKEFPEVQMAALKWLTGAILSRHDIPPERVLAHSDIAPDRKKDPGELFDWQEMAKNGVGLWPDPEDQDYKAADGYLADYQAGKSETLREAFTRAGYTADSKVDLATVITAFQRHFYQEAFKQPDNVGKPDREMGARLSWLIRNKPS